MTNAQAKQMLVEDIADFYRRYCMDEIGELAQQWPKERRSLVVDHGDLFRYDMDISDDVLSHPDEMRDYFTEAIHQIDEVANVDWGRVPDGVTIRFKNFGDEREVGQWRPDDLGNAFTVIGQIEQVSDVEPVLVQGIFECQRCGVETSVPQRGSGDDLQMPHQCPGCERQGPFQILREESHFRDRQMIRIKTPPEKAADGETHIDAVVEGDLAGKHTGDIGSRAAISGVLTLDESDDKSRQYPYLFNAEHIEVLNGTDDDDVEAEELEVLTESDDPIGDITENMMPGIYADEKMELIKEALVLQLVASPRIDLDDGTRIRGDWHMLLLGDPGTAKSEAIDEAHRLAPRAQLVGERATAAGLTVSATKDDFAGSQWSIKAGALVRANDGLCAIDEIDKIADGAVEALHNPMERQRVDATLADQSVSLPAHTAVLAAGNPEHGRFDPQTHVSDQINFPPTLLSRFDLIFLMKDRVDAERDVNVGEAIADNFLTALDKEATGSTDREEETRDIDPRIVRGYIARARKIVPTVKNDEVKRRAVEAYSNLRLQGANEDDPVPVTARKQAGIFRLAASSARARFSDTIDVEDIDRAVKLIKASMEDVEKDPETGQFDVDIVETGKPKTQRDRVSKIMNLIEELEAEHSEGAPYDVLEELAQEESIGPGTLERTIETLKEKGDVYQLNDDHIRST